MALPVHLRLALFGLAALASFGCDDAGREVPADLAADSLPSERIDLRAGRPDGALADGGLSCEHGASEGACLPEPPRSTPDTDCPSGRRLTSPYMIGDGVCLPDPPRGTPAEACPTNSWSPVEGMTGLGICNPAPVQMADWSCPAGWTATPGLADANGVEETVAGVERFTVCRPPSPGGLDCARGERFDMALGMCAVQGAGCPADAFPEDTALRARAGGFGAALVFVDATAPVGGDGSRALPVRTLSEALAIAPPGGIVALARGSHQVESAEISTGIAIVGACSADTVLTALASGPGIAAFSLTAVDQTLLADLTIGGGRSGVAVGTDAAVSMSGLRFEDMGAFAIDIQSSNASVVIDDTVVAGSAEHGIALGGGSLELRDAELIRISGTALLAGASSTLTVADSRIVGTGTQSVSSLGRGLVLAEGSEAALARVWFAELGDGVRALSASLTAEDVWIESLERGDDLDSVALQIANMPAALTRVGISGVGGNGILAANSDLSLTDVVIRDLDWNEDIFEGSHLIGVYAGGESTVDLNRVAIERVDGRGLQLGSSTLTSSDLIVRDTVYVGTFPTARTGHAVWLDGTATLERTLLDGAGGRMLHVIGEETSVVATDLVARNCEMVVFDEPSRSGEPCLVIRITEGDVDLTRVRVERANGFGAVVQHGRLAVTDGWFEDVPSADYRPGYTSSFATFAYRAPAGIAMYYRPQWESETNGSVIVDRAYFAGFVASGFRQWFGNGELPDGHYARLTDVVVRDIGPAVEQLEGFSELTSGFTAEGPGNLLEVERALVEHVSRAGLYGSLDARVVARDLEVADIWGVPVTEIDENGNEIVVGEGIGIRMQDGTAELERLWVRDGANHAVAISETSTTLRDVVVTDNAGRGLSSQQGSELFAERIILDNNGGIGLYVTEESGLTVSDAVVTDTRTAPCLTNFCDQQVEGFGVGLYDGSTMRLSRFALARNQAVGVAVDDGVLEAADGIISDTLIGVNVVAEGFDVTEAFENVVSLRNVVDIDQRALPVPAALEGIADESEAPPP